MAILFGTTANGETLPVEVNEFGQLIAEGLDGPPGPPGPPGIGELPPDPFEGAILGWKDNTLSWLSQVVPLPAGTYGPILEYANGILTLESSVNLPYLTAIFLSDAYGTKYSFQPVSSPITDIAGNVLTLENDQNLADFRVGDVVQPDPTWNQSQDWSAETTQDGGGTNFASEVFDGRLDTGGYPNWSGSPSEMRWTPPTPYAFNTSFRVNVSGQAANINGLYYKLVGQGEVQVNTGTSQNWQDISGPGAVEYVRWTRTNVSNASTIVWQMEADGLTLVDPGVISPNSVKITAIDEAAPSITTDGGSWIIGDPVVGPLKSGAGTVEQTYDNTIVLRQDNDQWCIGKYVTAPEQNLAWRYVNEDKIRSSL